ncbi:hypothetical protein QRX50_03375 [Amycolatopsis carbonis]|uniref:Uncharacterized protein n=1 Tax=Amycolatopsis carbonis TaxID=715471 RepID=A0A9Y2MSR5_9PSEU|nr:hypothetical protein [Amycolatopsis sp. 2-15]WIX79855.1 hypothetical protein QRX50_03375 [Amycolatopsis sp. 2-15]
MAAVLPLAGCGESTPDSQKAMAVADGQTRSGPATRAPTTRMLRR